MLYRTLRRAFRERARREDEGMGTEYEPLGHDGWQAAYKMVEIKEEQK